MLLVTAAPSRSRLRIKGPYASEEPSLSMKTAIVGLPMVGKTSLFTILTGVHEATRVGLMEARVGVTKVPDPRLESLSELFAPPKTVYAAVGDLGFPAISKGALRNPSCRAGLRNVDALAHVLRVFEDEIVPHE